MPESFGVQQVLLTGAALAGPKAMRILRDKHLVFMYFRQRIGWHCSL